VSLVQSPVTLPPERTGVVPAAPSPAGPPAGGGAAGRSGGPALTGAQRAAAVLLQMGPERAARVLKEMSDAEVTEIASAIASLPTLEAGTVEAVMGRFVDEARARLGVAQGGLEAAKRLLEVRLGPRQAQEVLTTIGAGPPPIPSVLGFLAELPTGQLAEFLADEHPQTIAVVLTQLPPEHAGAVLSELPGPLQPEVARRVAQAGRVGGDVLDVVGDVLRRRLAETARDNGPAASGGVASLVEILTRVDRGTEKGILADFDERDPELAEQIRSLLFVFDDVVKLDDRTLQKVLRHVVPGELAVALKASTDDVKEKFLRNLSERAAADLVDEMDLLGPVRLSQVEAAQAAVVRAVRELEAAGEVVLDRGEDDLVV